ncbi:MAG: SpoIIE family protein phosphatase [Alphaproteobacteria bacterium]|nr:SpoIIE family protein phosphatase [Alphaproteobacteria bacterium]
MHRTRPSTTPLTRLAEGQTTPADALERLKDLLRDGEDGLSDAALLMACQYEALADTLEGLVAGVREFEGVAASPGDELDRHLSTASNRFAIQLSAALFDTPFVEGSQASDTASTSVRAPAASFADLGEALTHLVGTSIRAAHHEKELELAGAVQRMIVPRLTELHPAVEVASWFRPAAQASGDWWTLAPLGKQDAMLCVGDVTGHGVPAALVTAILKGAVDMGRLGMRDALKPFMLMNMLNHVLLDNVDGDYLMTGVIARYELADQHLRIANAGHRSPWLFRANGTVEVLAGDRSPPIGTRRAQRYTETTVPFSRGDTLVVYTDGIPEANSRDGRELGDAAFRQALEQAVARGPDPAVAAVRELVLGHVEDESRLDDDVTLVVMRAR